MTTHVRIAAVAATILITITGSGCTWLKARAYEGFGRDGWQKPDEVIAALKIESGDRVADLGSGSGYFTIRLAKAVGPNGKVYAVDIDKKMNERLRQRLWVAGVQNAEIVLGAFEDPKLPDGEIDLIFTSNTYHHIQDRPTYFRNLQTDLSAKGRVAIIDFNGRKGWFVKLQGHFTPKEEVLEEMAEAGYEVDEDHTFIDRQSFIVFRPKP